MGTRIRITVSVSQDVPPWGWSDEAQPDALRRMAPQSLGYGQSARVFIYMLFSVLRYVICDSRW